MNALSQDPIQIDVETFDRLRRDTDEVCLLDVREAWERELCSIEPCLGVPLGQLPDRVDALPKDRMLVVICHHGLRSLRATQWLRGQGFPSAVNLEGGIDAWADRIDRTMTRY